MASTLVTYRAMRKPLWSSSTAKREARTAAYWIWSTGAKILFAAPRRDSTSRSVDARSAVDEEEPSLVVVVFILREAHWHGVQRALIQQKELVEERRAEEAIGRGIGVLRVALQRLPEGVAHVQPVRRAGRASAVGPLEASVQGVGRDVEGKHGVATREGQLAADAFRLLGRAAIGDGVGVFQPRNPLLPVPAIVDGQADAVPAAAVLHTGRAGVRVELQRAEVPQHLAGRLVPLLAAVGRRGVEVEEPERPHDDARAGVGAGAVAHLLELDLVGAVHVVDAGVVGAGQAALLAENVLSQGDEARGAAALEGAILLHPLHVGVRAGAAGVAVVGECPGPVRAGRAGLLAKPVARCIELQEDKACGVASAVGSAIRKGLYGAGGRVALHADGRVLTRHLRAWTRLAGAAAAAAAADEALLAAAVDEVVRGRGLAAAAGDAQGIRRTVHLRHVFVDAKGGRDDAGVNVGVPPDCHCEARQGQQRHEACAVHWARGAFPSFLFLVVQGGETWMQRSRLARGVVRDRRRKLALCELHRRQCRAKSVEGGIARHAASGGL
eukprot:scaffold1220_cov259-Pinguiococcus_pyrenoidosus.AAC.125